MTEHLQDFTGTEGAGALPARLGIDIFECSVERVVGSMPVDGNTQVQGVLHGGASLVLAESLGGAGASMHAGPGRIGVGIEINATHHRAARGGRVTGVATPVHLGRTLATYEVVITDAADRRVCTARITCFLRDL